jgi:flavodoxin
MKPSVLIVYHTVTKQSARVAEAIAEELEARGCEVTKALIEFTDQRWVPHLAQFPMKRSSR